MTDVLAPHPRLPAPRSTLRPEETPTTPPLQQLCVCTEGRDRLRGPPLWGRRWQPQGPSVRSRRHPASPPLSTGHGVCPGPERTAQGPRCRPGGCAPHLPQHSGCSRRGWPPRGLRSWAWNWATGRSSQWTLAGQQDTSKGRASGARAPPTSCCVTVSPGQLVWDGRSSKTPTARGGREGSQGLPLAAQ